MRLRQCIRWVSYEKRKTQEGMIREILMTPKIGTICEHPFDECAQKTKNLRTSLMSSRVSMAMHEDATKRFEELVVEE